MDVLYGKPERRAYRTDSGSLRIVGLDFPADEIPALIDWLRSTFPECWPREQDPYDRRD